jgi:hypothetical protein
LIAERKSLLAGGLIGLMGDWLGAPATVLVLGRLSLIATVYSLKLPEVSELARRFPQRTGNAILER